MIIRDSGTCNGTPVCNPGPTVQIKCEAECSISETERNGSTEASGCRIEEEAAWASDFSSTSGLFIQFSIISSVDRMGAAAAERRVACTIFFADWRQHHTQS